MDRDRARFHTTQWSLIAALPGRSGERDATRARAALEHLCDAYWRPLYAFARYSGYNADDAQDLTQAFLASVIESGGLGAADPARGRFRSYLLGAMKHFMAHQRERTRAQKRGGGRRFVERDIAEMESRTEEAKLTALNLEEGGAQAPPEIDRQIFYAHRSEDSARHLLYIYRFADPSTDPTREAFFRLLKSLQGQGQEGTSVEGLIAFHHSADCGLMLTGRGASARACIARPDAARADSHRQLHGKCMFLAATFKMRRR